MQQRGKHASVLGRLQPFIVARIEELEATLEHSAISDFNNWLVGLAQRSGAVQRAWLLGCWSACMAVRAGTQKALFVAWSIGWSSHPWGLLL